MALKQSFQGQITVCYFFVSMVRPLSSNLSPRGYDGPVGGLLQWQCTEEEAVGEALRYPCPEYLHVRLPERRLVHQQRDQKLPSLQRHNTGEFHHSFSVYLSGSTPGSWSVVGKSLSPSHSCSPSLSLCLSISLSLSLTVSLSEQYFSLL